jgi:type IV secretory pathway TraG/TraD family ATPase VirD4
MSAEKFNLDTVLASFPDSTGKQVDWTIRNAVEGVQIFGGIGSGKTSGSGRMLALKYLAAGFGGLVLTVKPQEREEWEEYCKIAGRSDDIVFISPKDDNYFNFLEYESGLHDGKTATDNILQVLKTVIQSRAERQAGRNNDAFWESALDMLIANTIDLCQIAYGKVSVKRLYDIVQSVPYLDKSLITDNDDNKPDGAYLLAFKKAREKVFKQRREYIAALPEDERNDFVHRIDHDLQIETALPELRTFSLVNQFFGTSYGQLEMKTRSIVDFSFSGFLYTLLRDPVYSLFCSRPTSETVKPEQCYKAGKIIVIDLPVKLHHKAGRDCQILYKYIWQRAMERRGKTTDDDRPVFLWADEAQNFLHEHDTDFQATARSSKVATVYISQNLPNYFGSMGGEVAEHKVKGFLGTLSTKIFHANADINTNFYASALIGESQEANISTNLSTETGGASTSVSRVFEKKVRPETFGILKTGGKANKGVVQGYMHIQGKKIGKDGNHILVNFSQDYNPKVT